MQTDATHNPRNLTEFNTKLLTASVGESVKHPTTNERYTVVPGGWVRDTWSDTHFSSVFIPKTELI